MFLLVSNQELVTMVLLTNNQNLIPLSHLQVNVAQDELNSFLSVAEELKVKGKSDN